MVYRLRLLLLAARDLRAVAVAELSQVAGVAFSSVTSYRCRYVLAANCLSLHVV